MTAIWVDTDFGFDDLWALLLLRQHGVRIAGLSLSFGCATLKDAIANAIGARRAYGLDIPLFAGADQPLLRSLETAQRVLGPSEMQSRGARLPRPDKIPKPPDALEGLVRWISKTPAPEILALGPLTNLAQVIDQHPDVAGRISRIVWMGGSAGRGNHTPAAEFNCFADPEAADCVARSGIPLDIVDLEICRSVTFGPEDMPQSDPLTSDLLGGYLDIALSRGRERMAIYDPLAALVMCKPAAFTFSRMRLEVETRTGADYGATRFAPAVASHIRLATACAPVAMAICLSALTEKDPAHVR